MDHVHHTTIDYISPDYLERVRHLVAKFRRELAEHPESIYARACLRGWEAELGRLESELNDATFSAHA